MKTKDISRVWDAVKPAPRPGHNPIPVRPEPEQQPMEPDPTRGPKRKKKGLYEIECNSACC